jgi:tetrahydromethanopterin S-methyltransferase subunit G
MTDQGVRVATGTTHEPAAPDPAELAAAREIARRKRLLQLYALLLLVPLAVIALILVGGRSEREALRSDVRSEVSAQAQDLAAGVTARVDRATAELRESADRQLAAAQRAESRLDALERAVAAPPPKPAPVPGPNFSRELDALRGAIASQAARVDALTAGQTRGDSAQSALRGELAAVGAALAQQGAVLRRIEERLDRLEKRAVPGAAIEPAELAELRRRLAELEARVVTYEGAGRQSR